MMIIIDNMMIITTTKRLAKWVPGVGSTKTLLCACSRVHSRVSVPVIGAFLNFSGVVWTENILSVF